MPLIGISLIMISGVCLAVALLWTRFRAFFLVAGSFALLNSYFAAPLNWTSFIGGTGFWLAPIVPGEPPIPLEKLALPTDSPEAMMVKMGCYVCHRIPGVPRSRQSDLGPLLIPGATAREWIKSDEYRARVQAGRARAATPREYVLESILDPDAFIIPGFADRKNPERSLMYPLYGERFTQAALEKLVAHLLTLDVQAAVDDGLIFAHQAPPETQ